MFSLYLLTVLRQFLCFLDWETKTQSLRKFAWDIQVIQGSASFSVAQSRPTLCGPMDCSMLGFPVLHHLPDLAQTHVH